MLFRSDLDSLLRDSLCWQQGKLETANEVAREERIERTFKSGAPSSRRSSSGRMPPSRQLHAAQSQWFPGVGDDGRVSNTSGSEIAADVSDESWNPVVTVPESLWDLAGSHLATQVTQWQEAMRLYGATLLMDMATLAEEKILHAALNDGLALVDHVGRLDGRSAAHSARALFEHLVNLRDVQTSAENTARRFEDHKHALAEQVSQRRWYLALLDLKTRQREEKRLDRMGRAAAAPLAAALGKYTGFRQGWADGGLRTRAEALGLTAGYEGYRIMTGVLHGSSGALAGVTRDARGDQPSRIGPDLDLAAMAYAEGMSTLVQLFEGLIASGGDDARELHHRSVGLLRGLPRVREALRTMEETLWPTTPPPAPVEVAVVALYATGARRWYVYDPRQETVVVAHPPADEPDLSSGLAALEDYDNSVWGGRPVTMMFEGLKVVPREGAIAVPASAVLVPGAHRGI